MTLLKGGDATWPGLFPTDRRCHVLPWLGSS
jgi:hypothetical protein